MEQTVTCVIRKVPSLRSSDMLIIPFSSRVVRSPSLDAGEVESPLGKDVAQSVGTHSMATTWPQQAQAEPYSFDSEDNPLSKTSNFVHDPMARTSTQNSQETTPIILVVEDDPDISMALQDLLEFEGFNVECVETCSQAFSSISQQIYDAVLLDLGLPDGDGRSVLERLHYSRPTIPVIVLSATNQDLGLLHPYARLTKPWDREELCTILHRAIGTDPKRA
jgi:CheY-like chemotaxis protein